MFASDKELRSKKPGPAKGRPVKPSPSSSAATQDIVEVARHAREERQFAREHSNVATRLQAWWRARHQLRQWRLDNAAELSRKLADIRKLDQLLKTHICPDAHVALRMIRLLVFSCEPNENLQTFCALVLIPSLTSMDPAKNVAALSSPYLAYIMFLHCLRFLGPRPRYSVAPSAEDQRSVASSLSLLAGGGASFRMTFTSALEASFKRIRRELEGREVLRSVGSLLFSRLEGWMLSTSDLDEASSMLHPQNSHSGCLDSVLSFCSDFVLSDKECESSRLLSFLRDVLSVPMATLLFSNSALESVIDTDIINAIVDSCLRLLPSLDLAPSPLPALQAEIWLLGNIVALFRYRLKSSPPILMPYIQLITRLLITYPVPGLLQGRRGVAWMRRGAESIAAGVPTGLYLQMSTLLDFHVLSTLTATFLGFDIGNFDGNPKDVTEIEEALRSNSASITLASINEVAADRSWVSGRWAVKFLSSVAGSLSSRPSSYPAKINRSGIVDPKSALCLTGLWAVAVAPAALASYRSDNWKGITSLAFSDLNVAARLWRLLLHLRVEDFCAAFHPARDADLAGVFGVMVTLASILRVNLLVCDDQELIADSRPLPLHQTYLIIRCFKLILFKIIQQDSQILSNPTKDYGENSNQKQSLHSLSARVISLMLSNLHARWARRPFSLPSLFEIPEANTRAMRNEMRAGSPFATAILTAMYVIVSYYFTNDLNKAMGCSIL